jgi:hypothetical protein
MLCHIFGKLGYFWLFLSAPVAASAEVLEKSQK